MRSEWSSSSFSGIFLRDHPLDSSSGVGLSNAFFKSSCTVWRILGVTGEYSYISSASACHWKGRDMGEGTSSQISLTVMKPDRILASISITPLISHWCSRHSRFVSRISGWSGWSIRELNISVLLRRCIQSGWRPFRFMPIIRARAAL